jgi:hypothetical protein
LAASKSCESLPQINFHNITISGLGCVKNEKRFGDDPEGKLLLAQVEICLDKNLNLIDCKDKLFGGCSPTKAVNYYPRETHRSIQSDRANSKLGSIFIAAEQSDNSF